MGAGCSGEHHHLGTRNQTQDKGLRAHWMVHTWPGARQPGSGTFDALAEPPYEVYAFYCFCIICCRQTMVGKAGVLPNKPGLLISVSSSPLASLFHILHPPSVLPFSPWLPPTASLQAWAWAWAWMTSGKCGSFGGAGGGRGP